MRIYLDDMMMILYWFQMLVITIPYHHYDFIKKNYKKRKNSMLTVYLTIRWPHNMSKTLMQLEKKHKIKNITKQNNKTIKQMKHNGDAK